MKTYKQLTQELRYRIYQPNKIGWLKSDIADEIDVHKPTIGREIKRNSGKRGYRPKQAQEIAVERRNRLVKQ